MDVIFGSISADQRHADIQKHERSRYQFSLFRNLRIDFVPSLELDNEPNHETKSDSDQSLDHKV